jgi:hypothetical protein
MSDYIQKRMKKLKVNDEDIVKWANANGYASLLPGNIAMVRQIYIDAHDDEELEYPDLEMRGKRVAVKDIPLEEWVIIRVFMFKIARTTKYSMCPEPGCYARVQDSECKAREEKSHGYVAEPTVGIRHYYLAGDGDKDGKSTYVIVPAKYAMNGYNFEKSWCDVKGVWNDQLEGFYANVIMPLSEEELKRTGVAIPEISSEASSEEEEVAEIPTNLDLSAFTKKKEEASTAPVDEDKARYEAELKNFLQIIPFFGAGNYTIADFDDFITSNEIKTPLTKLIENTPGCRVEGEGRNAKVFYTKP